MDSVKAERSMFFGGDWHDAFWCAEVVNEATGELSVMATAADLGDGKRLPPVVVMRMTMALVQELRALAGFRQAQPAELRQAQPAEAAEGITQRMGTANEPAARDIADAKVYDDYHLEWERDEWRNRALRMSEALERIVAIGNETQRGNATWTDLFGRCQQMAREALGDEA